MIPRGIRNNNPLNIRRSKDQWQGMKKTQSDRIRSDLSKSEKYSAKSDDFLRFLLYLCPVIDDFAALR